MAPEMEFCLLGPLTVRKGGQAVPSLAAKQRVMLAALLLRAGRRRDGRRGGSRGAHAWQIPWALEDYFFRSGHWHDWTVTQREALAAAERLRHLGGQANAHRNLGRISVLLGSLDDGQPQGSAGRVGAGPRDTRRPAPPRGGPGTYQAQGTRCRRGVCHTAAAVMTNPKCHGQARGALTVYRTGR
jgi:hypothetical protein